MIRFSKESREPKGDRLMTLKDLMAWLGIGETTARKMVREREIPSYRIGGYIRFKKDEIEEWLKTQCRMQPIS